MLIECFTPLKYHNGLYQLLIWSSPNVNFRGEQVRESKLMLCQLLRMVLGKTQNNLDLLFLFYFFYNKLQIIINLYDNNMPCSEQKFKYIETNSLLNTKLKFFCSMNDFANNINNNKTKLIRPMILKKQNNIE